MNPNHSNSTPMASPCVMVIFGATGDLTKRKLIPALCNLAQDHLLADAEPCAANCFWKQQAGPAGLRH